ncbi:MAG TPA: hypothetical protein VFR78_15670 [Pyrinomonadaceae bacterium]|nr:hypothetical protein [Pyrinomonadaceae bacterium]
MNIKRVLPLILALAVAVILYLFSANWSRRQRTERLDNGFAAIKAGDSRDAVVAAMGKPHSVEECPFTPFSDKKMEAEFRSKCSQQYKYVVFMKVYTISFDRDGTVIHKSDVVSP